MADGLPLHLVSGRVCVFKPPKIVAPWCRRAAVVVLRFPLRVRYSKLAALPLDHSFVPFAYRAECVFPTDRPEEEQNPETPYILGSATGGGGGGADILIGKPGNQHKQHVLGGE